MTSSQWTARRMKCQSNDNIYSEEVVDFDGKVVASLLRKTDAPLIAAAPELFAALKEIMQWRGQVALHECVARAEKALAMVEGD